MKASKGSCSIRVLAVLIPCAVCIGVPIFAQPSSPEVDIVSPEPRGYYSVEDIVLVAFTVTEGWDWEAEVDGEVVESGDELDFAAWTVGRHSLTVRATDISGREVVKTVTFTVNPLIQFDPQVLNLAAHGGSITCYIKGLGVENIDPDTIQLSAINGEPLSEPIFVRADYDPELVDEDDDGLPDVIAEFDRERFIAYLYPGEVDLDVSLLAETVLGERLEATDTIVVVHRPPVIDHDQGQEARDSSSSPGAPSPGIAGRAPAVASTLPSPVAGRGVVSADGRMASPVAGRGAVSAGGVFIPAGFKLARLQKIPPGIELWDIKDPATGRVVGLMGRDNIRGIAWGAMALPLEGQTGRGHEGISARLLAYGIARGEPGEVIEDKDGEVAAAVYWNMKSGRLLRETDRFPLEDGNIMYIRFRLSNLTPGREIKGLRRVVIFPPPGMVDPDGNVFKRSEQTLTLKPTQPEFAGDTYWTFSDQSPFEMVSGEWTWQIWHKDRLLLEKRFNAYKP